MTAPAVGDKVYVYDLPEGNPDGMPYEGDEHCGESTEGLGCETWAVELDNGQSVAVKTDDLEVERDPQMPMWRALWQFNDPCDAGWMDDGDGVRVMSECGFRIYHHDEWGYFFGIDGAGYDSLESHWHPAYLRRGLEWHGPEPGNA